MKIAAVTDDGVSISPHFGRAASYAVITVEEGRVVKREMRDKLGHADFAGHEQQHSAEERHGFGPDARHRHTQMIDAIRDCQVLLARGMGWGARHSLADAGIKPILTDIEDIDVAAKAYMAGEIVDHTELLH